MAIATPEVPATDPPPRPSGMAGFRCRVTYLDDRARVVVTGRLNAATMPVVRRMVLAAAVLPITGVTVDLGGVESIDRDAIRVFVSLREQVRDYNAAFLIASAPDLVHRAFANAGVEESFEYESLWSRYPSTTELT